MEGLTLPSGPDYHRLVISANKGKKCSTSFFELTLLSYFRSGMEQREGLSQGLSCTLFREVIKDGRSQCSAAAKRNRNTNFSITAARVSESFFASFL